VWSREIIVPKSVFFVKAGHGKIKTQGRTLEIARGQAFLAEEGTRRQWFASDTRLLSVGFRATWPGGIDLAMPSLNVVLSQARCRSLLKATQRLFRTVHGGKKSVTYPEAIQLSPIAFSAWSAREAAFREWFAVYAKTMQGMQLAPSSRQQPLEPRVREIVQRLDAWPLRRTFDSRELIHGIGMGVRRMEQLFTRELGLTPNAYLARRRIEEAKRMLMSSQVPLKQIAYELGLRHASHFTKWFRLHSQVSPSVYRAESKHAL
jgi:AraC-like DNA-binding protein